MFGGDYWILAVGENYAYAVVSSSSRDYAWILSRTPHISKTHLNEANLALLKQGFDTCKFIATPQIGGLQDRSFLCNLEK
jgi:apolipoprotein D and lipocalin family protein